MHFILASLFMCIGMAFFFFEKNKNNYVFILQLPQQIMVYGWKNIMKLSSIHLFVVCTSSVLCIASQCTF